LDIKQTAFIKKNEANIPLGFVPGDFRIADVNNDGKVTPEDRTILGNTLPNYSFSVSNSLRLKNVSFYVLVNSIQGGVIIRMSVTIMQPEM
jgi:hypothetical protein